MRHGLSHGGGHSLGRLWRSTCRGPRCRAGPGGHYLGHQHIQDNFQRAFFMPKLFDNNSIEQWQAEGSKEINEQALDEVKAMLDAYIEPKLDPAVDEALLDYTVRRERQITAR